MSFLACFCFAISNAYCIFLSAMHFFASKCETSALEQNFHFHFEEQDFPRSIADFSFVVDKLKTSLIRSFYKKVGKQIDFFPLRFCPIRNVLSNPFRGQMYCLDAG